MMKNRTLAGLAAALALFGSLSAVAAPAAPKACPKGKFLATVKSIEHGPKTIRVVMADPKTGQPVDDSDVPLAKFEKEFKAYKVGTTVCHPEPGQD